MQLIQKLEVSVFSDISWLSPPISYFQIIIWVKNLENSMCMNERINEWVYLCDCMCTRERERESQMSEKSCRIFLEISKKRSINIRVLTSNEKWCSGDMRADESGS